MKLVPVLPTVAAILVITFVSGIVQGTLSGRWGPSEDLVAAGEALGSLPHTIADWEMQSESKIEETTVEVLRCTGSVSRIYVNRVNGQLVKMALIVGPPGPISVHKPEICYSSQNYTQQGERQRVHVEAIDGSNEGYFWALTFKPNNLNGVPFRVYYAWSDGGPWQAVENPRVSRSNAKLLYKIQLSGNIAAIPSADNRIEPCKSFLEALLALPDMPLVAR